MVAQASQSSPISYISWREQRELELAHTAPDIASLALYDHYPHPEVISCLKGIVQRDLTGVEIRLKRSALMNYIVAKFSF
jgi:hypothetical protein